MTHRDTSFTKDSLYKLQQLRGIPLFQTDSRTLSAVRNRIFIAASIQGITSIYIAGGP